MTRKKRKMCEWKWRDMNNLIRLLDILTYFYVIVSFPPHTHHHHLTSESIDPPRKRKVFQLKIAQFIHHFQDRTLSTQYIALLRNPPTLSPTNPRWSNWVKLKSFHPHLLRSSSTSGSPPPSLSNLINDNQIRNSNWAIIRSSIKWQLFAIW